MIRKEWEDEKPVQGGLAIIQSSSVMGGILSHDGILYVTHDSFSFLFLFFVLFFCSLSLSLLSFSFSFFSFVFFLSGIFLVGV